MANSVNGEVVSFDSTCKEALKKHFQIFDMSHTLKSEPKTAISTLHGFWKGS